MKSKIVKVITATLCIASMMGRPVVLNECKEINGARTADQSKTEISTDQIEIFCTDDIEQFEECTKALESRNGKIIMEVVHGTVLDDEGNGRLDSGYYIKYHTGKKGDRIESIFIYDPATNAVDDIAARQDRTLK